MLISSAGRRVELIHCFRSGAKSLGLNLRVIAVDTNPEMSAACHVADKAYKISRCTSPQFITDLANICADEGVHLVVPTIDTELQIMADHKDRFKASGTRIVVSSHSIVRLARNKEATAQFLKDHGIGTPRTAAISELLANPQGWLWPLILKPINGSSSVGISVVPNLDEARLASTKRDDLIAQEFLRGREYTVNIFFDQFGVLRSAVPHLRNETRSGEVSKGTTERHSALTSIAWKLGEILQGATGPLCFQAIVTDAGECGVFEINARFGGGYPLADRAGAVFAKWLLEETAGLESSATNEWQEGLTMLRYDAALFWQANSK
ncbi:MAG TPA: ATP-grasp domain-containing protein [Verrucomicrobiae bacterium]